MTTLLTGCAGFIGYHVGLQLLGEGRQIVGVDDLNDHYDPRLKEWRLGQLQNLKGFKFHKADVGDLASVEPLFGADPPEAILNLAARAGVRQSLQDPWGYVRTNMTGTLNLLELARKHDVSRFVLASTSSLYGKHNATPFREDADTNRPLSPYAASKKGAEALAATYHHLYGIHTPVLRYFTVYGPAGRPDMSVMRFIRWINEGDPIVVYGDGKQSRDFTFVDDIARGTIAALDLKGHDVVNLGGDEPHTLNELIAIIEGHLGKRAKIDRRPLAAADVPATWADITKARKLLRWEPKTPLKAGVKVAVEWYLENRSWAKSLQLGDT